MSGSNVVVKKKTPVKSPATPKADKFTSKVLPDIRTAKPSNQFG